MSKNHQNPAICILLLLICSQITSCQHIGPPAPVVSPNLTTPPQTAAPAQPPASSPNQPLIEYLSELRKLSPSRLSVEASQLRGRLQADPSTDLRLRLAVCLALLPGEEAEALTHLEAISNQPKTAELALIFELLLTNVRERRRYRESVSSLQSRNREAGKQQEDLKNRQEALKRQIEELERKLAALRDIEKSLLQRP